MQWLATDGEIVNLYSPFVCLFRRGKNEQEIVEHWERALGCGIK